MNVISVHSSTLLQQMVVMVDICWFETHILAQPIGITHAYWMKIPTSILNMHQLLVNMFFEECSRSNKPILICPLPGNVLTWATGGLKEGTVLNDIGTPWGRRQTLRGSEQVICSALLHVKWDTFTLSRIIFCSSSQPRFLFSPKEKLYKGSEQRALGVFLSRVFYCFSYISLLQSSLSIDTPLLLLFFFHTLSFLSSVSLTHIVRLCLFL